MLTSLLSSCVALLLAQAPASASSEAAWLKVIPADAEIVAHARPLGSVRDDLVSMLEAASPNVAAQAKPVFEQGLAALTQLFGEQASKAPFMVVMRLPKDGELGTPPHAVLLKSTDYDSVLKGLAGPQGNAKPKAEEGGFDSIKGPDGLPRYTYKGAGFVAFSNNEFLMGAIAKPKATLDSALKPGARERLLGGDLGIYVNLERVQTRYADQIDQARQALMTQMDAAQGQAGGADFAKIAKDMYGKMFDGIKDGQVLTLNFDFGGDGLGVAGEVSAKPGSATAKFLVSDQTSAAGDLAKMPKDLANYFYFNSSSVSIEKIQNWGLSMVTGMGADQSAELKKAQELLKQAGGKDMTGGSATGAGGIRGLSIMNFAHPEKAVEALTAMSKASMSGKSPMAAMFKDYKVEPNAERYRGFVFNRTNVKIDVAKLNPAQPKNEEAANALKAVMGDSMTTWVGTDGKVVLNVVATSWDKAKAMIDTEATGKGGLGDVPSYQALRKKLPKMCNGLILTSAQGMLVQIAAQLAARDPNNPAFKTLADLPAEPALIGTAVNMANGAVQFQTFVPKALGEIIEKGYLPVIQAASGKQNQ